MKFLMVLVLATFWATTAFARGGLVPGVTSKDCTSTKTKKQAKKRVLKNDIGKVWSGRKARKRLTQQIEATCDVLSLSAKNKINVPQGDEDMTLLEKLEADLFTNIEPCQSGKGKKALAKHYGLSIRTVAKVCSKVVREVMASGGSDNSSILGELLLGAQLDEILRDVGLERNPNAIRLRREFMNAYKPGIHEEVETPYELLNRYGEPWYCVANQPFVSTSTMVNTDLPNEIGEMVFNNMGTRLWSNDDFRGGDTFFFDPGNGMEITGANASGEIMRHIRLHYFCEKGEEDCGLEEEPDLRVLIIEETVKTRGLLSRFFDWVNGLGFNKKETVHNYLATRARRGKNDYFENGGKCNGKNLILGCEMAVNYFECWDDIEAVATFYGQNNKFINRLIQHRLKQLQTTQ